VLDPEGWTAITPVAITDEGVVVGSYQSGDGLTHGFIRDLRGNYTTINVPGAAGASTIPVAVDPQGSIVGYYCSDCRYPPSAFYRLRDGTFGFFTPPGSTGTYPTAIGPQGDITGYFLDAAGNTQLHSYQSRSAGYFYGARWKHWWSTRAMRNDS
jgi:hypothetical protein